MYATREEWWGVVLVYFTRERSDGMLCWCVLPGRRGDKVLCQSELLGGGGMFVLVYAARVEEVTGYCASLCC